VELLWRAHRTGRAVQVIVSDDDSTFRAKTKHSYQALIGNGQLLKEDWPRHKRKDGGFSKVKGKDYGRLPLEVPSLTSHPLKEAKLTMFSVSFQD